MADKNFKVKTGLSLPSPLPVDQGGTGQTSATNTLNALLPVQTNNANKVLQTDGTNTTWYSVPAPYTRGVTSQRPASPTAGDLFFNTEKKAFEVWTGSAWVSVAVNGAVPLPPTIGTASLTGLTASVPFTGPTDFGDAAISTYTATSNPGSISVSSASSPISVPGLTAATAYTFTVTATNSYGISNASSASNSVTTANVPGAPTSVTAADTGIDGEALIEWTAPGSNGGSAITDYVIEYSSNGGSSYTVFSDGTSTATSYTATGLTLDTTYIFRVKAVNLIGTGTASTATSNYVTVFHDPSAYFPIQTTTLAANASTIVFSSIPQTYTHLQLRGSVATSAGAYIGVTFNGVTTGSFYDGHHLSAQGTSASSGAYTSRNDIPLQSSNTSSTASAFGGLIIDILDYTNTNKNKTVKSLSGFVSDGSGTGYSYLESGLWRNTAAITSITLVPGSSHTMTANTSFTLYGIKG